MYDETMFSYLALEEKKQKGNMIGLESYLLLLQGG